MFGSQRAVGSKKNKKIWYIINQIGNTLKVIRTLFQFLFLPPLSSQIQSKLFLVLIPTDNTGDLEQKDIGLKYVGTSFSIFEGLGPRVYNSDNVGKTAHFLTSSAIYHG